MSRNAFVLLGGNVLNAGVSSAAKKLGQRVIVVDWNEHVPAEHDLHLRLDIKDDQGVLKALAPHIDEVAWAYTSADVATETVAKIHQAIGLRRPTAESLTKARNKALMNEAWSRAGILGKAYALCRGPEAIASFARNLDRDVVVKPHSQSSSRGITVLTRKDFIDDLIQLAWTRAVDKSPDAPEVLVEEFIHGTEFTVEMVGDSSGNVHVWAVSKKYHTRNAGKNRVAVKLHYNAPDVSRERQARIAAFGAHCYRELGLRTSLGHLEVMERPDGTIVPVELAARSSGFIASHLVDAAAGLPGTFFDEYRAVLAGETVPDDFVRPSGSSMYFFYDFPTGKWTGRAEGLVPYLPKPVVSLWSDRSRLTPGSTFGEIDSDTERAGHEIIAGPSEALTIEGVVAAETACLEANFTPKAGTR